MGDPVSVRDQIRAAFEANPDASPEAIAGKVYRKALKRDLFYLLLAEVRGLHRELVRENELRSWRSTIDELQRKHPRRDRIDLGLLRQQIAIDLRGQRVSEGRMTSEQWAARRAMLIPQRDTLDYEITRCNEAIALLEATGAPCLDALIPDEASDVA